MEADKLSEVESVSSIYLSMDLGSEPVDVDKAKTLISDDFSDVKTLPDQSQKIIDPQIEIEKLVFSLQTHKTDLISVLVLLKCTWINACTIYHKLMDSIQFCQDQIKISPCAFKYKRRLTHCRKDLLFVVQNVAENYFCGSQTLLCSKENELSLFYCLLARISNKSGYGALVTVLTDEILIRDSANLYELDELMSANNVVSTPYPVIITEDADISASADSISRSICRSQIQESFLVSHVFIQESVYEISVLLLKDRLRSLKHGSRFDKRTEVELIDNGKTDMTSDHAQLEVFTPCENSPIKLCIGWNPKDIDQSQKFSKACGYIVVMPYRNVAELKSLIKENIELTGPVTIWSERINVLNLDLEQEFSTVWINCHGYVSPLSTSTASYNIMHDGKPKTSGIPPLMKEPFTTEQVLQYEELNVIRQKLNEGHLKWQKPSIEVQMKLIDFLQKETDCKNCSINQRHTYSRASPFAPEVRVLSSVKPVGRILLFCGSHVWIEMDRVCLRQIVASALLNGNTVVLGGRNNDEINCYRRSLCDISNVNSFLDSLQLMSAVMPDCISFMRALKGRHPGFGVVLYMAENTLDVLNYCSLKKHYQVDLSACYCPKFLNELTTTTCSTYVA